MDLATQSHLSSLRESLNYRLRELRAELHAADQARQAAAAGRAQEVTDLKDLAARSEDSTLLGDTERRASEEAALVEAALHRLDAGRYGDCQDCGEPIALQRLQVQPAALRCAHCQTAFERSGEAGAAPAHAPSRQR